MKLNVWENWENIRATPISVRAWRMAVACDIMLVLAVDPAELDCLNIIRVYCMTLRRPRSSALGEYKLIRAL